MIRFPKNEYSNLRVPGFREEEETIQEARINGGMVTTIDSADLENSQFSDLKNVYVRNDRVSRRYGNNTFTPVAPDTNKVLHITPFERFSGTVAIIRMAASTIYSGTVTTWNAVVGVLSGGANDRFNTTTVNDRFFFSNNGADYIQELNPSALTFARAGNAPKYRYLTAFNNRLIGANLSDTTPNPIQVGWSGDLNFAEWDAATDISAGFNLLIDSPTDYSDDITGIFGFAEFALVLRERSLWGMSKQPVATSPFNFFVISPGLGCDSPNSAVSIRNGIAWFDFRTGSVYIYTNGTPEVTNIGRPIESTLLSQITSVATIFASYNTVDDEYILCLPSETSTLVKMWTYNFRTQAWAYEEISDVSALANIDYSTSTLVIEDLVGTIEALTGTIEALSNTIAIASRFYGKTNGDILIQNKSVDTDAAVAYTTSLTSKTFYIPRYNGYVSQLRIEYIPRLAGSFTTSFTKDGGITWTTYKTVTWVNGDIGKRKLATFKRHLRCAQYNWKLESTGGLFELIEYEISITTSRAETRSR